MSISELEILPWGSRTFPYEEVAKQHREGVLYLLDTLSPNATLDDIISAVISYFNFDDSGGVVAECIHFHIRRLKVTRPDPESLGLSPLAVTSLRRFISKVQFSPSEKSVQKAHEALLDDITQLGDVETVIVRLYATIYADSADLWRGYLEKNALRREHHAMLRTSIGGIDWDNVDWGEIAAYDAAAALASGTAGFILAWMGLPISGWVTFVGTTVAMSFVIFLNEARLE